SRRGRGGRPSGSVRSIRQWREAQAGGVTAVNEHTPVQSASPGTADVPGPPDATVRHGSTAVAIAGASGGAFAASEASFVLVVDDTEGNRYTVSRLLRDAGLAVREAATIADAYRHLESAVPALVVLDINLPDGS